MEFSSTDVFGYQLLHTMYINIIVRMNAKTPTSDHNFDETVNISFGSFSEINLSARSRRKDKFIGMSSFYKC